jgi:crotonobetaine/carnitine-CoA ligase
MSSLSPFGTHDVGWLIETRARARGLHRFLIWDPPDGAPGEWTYEGFARDVASFAAGLRGAGVGAGDRVAILLNNDPYFLIAWSAIVSSGAVAVCLNARSSRDELRYAGEHSSVVAAITSADLAEDVGAAMPWLRWICRVDVQGDLGRLMGDPAEFDRRPVDPFAAASVQYTSGTTAHPKAVVWTHANCLWGGRVNAAHQELTRADVNLLHLPLFHTNALSYSFLASWWAGATVVLHRRFSASRFWDTSVRYGCTWSSVVAFCLRALDGRPVPDVHHYRGWANSYVVPGAASPAQVSATGWFGMTETVSHPIHSQLGDGSPAGSMGYPALEYRVAVVDDDGRPAAREETGELLVAGVRGVSLFAEYAHDAAATSAAFTDDGWFRTGDRVRVGHDGSLTFVERHQDVLKVGGENIGAPEIERVVRGVDFVREAAVVGRPDRMLGEVPVVFVVADGDAADVVRLVNQRCAELLPEFKRPREVRVVPTLPRSQLEKIAKSALRAQLLQASLDGESA